MVRNDGEIARHTVRKNKTALQVGLRLLLKAHRAGIASGLPIAKLFGHLLRACGAVTISPQIGQQAPQLTIVSSDQKVNHLLPHRQSMITADSDPV